ncbi:MAG: hypothetical protein EXR86_10245 [Gammaproteobacteria bacterium]|nr:hypothetical protein [Gammaproteobacteria bacterium]
MSVTIQVSYGELIDKITILEIKVTSLRDPKKLQNVQRDLDALNSIFASTYDEINNEQIVELRANLKVVNKTLWDIEDAIRYKESAKTFDSEFIELARSVYIVNDERSRLKRCIDELVGSQITEEKSYQPY